MFYVYVLYINKESKLYYGFTNNLKRRLLEHKSEGYLKGKDFELVYYEAHKNKKDAMRREKYYKSGWGRSYIKRMLENYLKRENR